MDARFLITGKLNAFDQLDIIRKLSNVLPIIDGVVRDENKGKEKSVLIVMALGMISDEHNDYIVKKCLSLVSMMQEGNSGAAKILVNGNLMFSDITLKDILDITAKVIEDNLGDFFSTARSEVDM
jgi:hypothetical protein